MERRPRKSYDRPGYPSRGAWLRARARAAAVGLVVTSVAVPACMGSGRLAGDMVVPRETGDTATRIPGDTSVVEEERDVRLPESGSRELVFSDPWGEIEYHVEAVVLSEASAAAVSRKATEILAELDRVLGGRPVTDFRGVPDLSAVEAELSEALARVADLEPEAIVSLALFIDSYTDNEDIPGDMPAARP